MSRNFDRAAAIRPRQALGLLAGSAALLITQQARAEDLSLQSVVKLALSRNERAEIANQNVVAADAALAKARAAFLPSLSLSAGETYRPQQAETGNVRNNSATAALTLSQPLFNATAFPLYVMAFIDSRRYALSVSSAKAALEGASAAAADAEASLNRRKGASESNPGVIAAEELETYQTKLRTAQASVDQATEALKLAQLNLDDSNLKTPVAGTVQTRSVETGQYVQAGTVVATLLQRDPMLLHFNVTSAEAPRLKVGMPVEFTLKDSQSKYTGKITLVAGAADPESRLVPATAQIDTQETHQFWLRPGSFAQVEVKMPSTRVFAMIPQTAARPSERGFLAYVVTGEVAHEHTLTLGLHTPDGMVEVKSGLNAGDQLVTRGVEALTDGAKVKVVSTMPAGTSDEVSDAGVGPVGSAAALAGAATSAADGGAKPRKRRDGGAPPLTAGEP